MIYWRECSASHERNRDVPSGICAMIALLSATTVAYANAGTALVMLPSMRFFTMGNAFIGVFEGLIVAVFIKRRLGLALLLMIVANCCSGWCGRAGMVLFRDHFFSRTLLSLDRLPWLLVGTLSVSFVATVLLEWPFVMFIFRGQRRLVPRSFAVNLLAQVVSNAVGVCLYLLIGNFSVLTQADFDPSLSFVKNRQAEVYFVSPDGKSIERIGLDGTGKTKLMEIGDGHIDILRLLRAEQPGYWNLVAHRTETENREELLMPDILLGEIVDEKYCEHDHGLTVDLRRLPAPLWSFRTGYWPQTGLEVLNRVSGESFNLGLDTPFVAWMIRNVTILPGDEIVFATGDAMFDEFARHVGENGYFSKSTQIYVFDRASRRIGFLAEGLCPLVVLRKSSWPSLFVPALKDVHVFCSTAK